MFCRCFIPKKCWFHWWFPSPAMENPEVMTVNMAASACERSGRWEEAVAILSRALEAEVFNGHSYGYRSDHPHMGFISSYDIIALYVNCIVVL